MKKNTNCVSNDCPRQHIDLDGSNFKCRIFVVVFCRQTQWKKSKQIFKIRHFQINELPRTYVFYLKTLIVKFEFYFIKFQVRTNQSMASKPLLKPLSTKMSAQLFHDNYSPMSPLNWSKLRIQFQRLCPTLLWKLSNPG